MKKKINRKGFTLIELLAVVVILLLISTIAISSISAAIERQNEKKDNATKDIIISYAKLYFDDYKNSIGDNPCVDVAELIDEYNLDEKTLRNSNGELFNGSVKSDYLYHDENCLTS